MCVNDLLIFQIAHVRTSFMYERFHSAERDKKFGAIELLAFSVHSIAASRSSKRLCGRQCLSKQFDLLLQETWIYLFNRLCPLCVLTANKSYSVWAITTSKLNSDRWFIATTAPTFSCRQATEFLWVRTVTSCLIKWLFYTFRENFPIRISIS